MMTVIVGGHVRMPHAIREMEVLVRRGDEGQQQGGRGDDREWASNHASANRVGWLLPLSS